MPHTTKRRGTALAAALAMAVSACAQNPDNIGSSYVPEAQYRNLPCEDIRVEMARMSTKVAEVTDKQRSSANTDAAMVGVSLILFWPAAFALAATSDQSAELARLKGEYEALERVHLKQGCARDTRVNAGPQDGAVIADTSPLVPAALTTKTGFEAMLTSGGTVSVLDRRDQEIIASQGGNRQHLYGLFLDWKHAGTKENRAAVDALWPLEVGKESHFWRYDGTGAEETRWKVLRTETVTVPAGTFPAVVVETVRRPQAGSDEVRTIRWYAPSIGWFVKQTVEFKGKRPPERNWEMVEIVRRS
ncbi:MAG: hypothetical protein HQL38_18105 [Alphaproteobacteria bacterium]|nr:hypothetical protein [Alphaproteobacteria bacterium]